MNDLQLHSLQRYLNLLKTTGASDNIMLIGSWAEYAYMAGKVLPGYLPDIRTLDIDFLIRNKLKPRDPVSIIAAARNDGFEVMTDRLTSCTKLYDENGLEAEFLISKVGAGIEVSLKTNVGVTAQSLRYLDILSSYPIQVQLFGQYVLVPEPEAYFVHKLIINSDRRGKADKDFRQLLRLAPYLSETRVFEISNRLGKKTKRRFMDSLARFRQVSMDCDFPPKSSETLAEHCEIAREVSESLKGNIDSRSKSSCTDRGDL